MADTESTESVSWVEEFSVDEVSYNFDQFDVFGMNEADKKSVRRGV